MNEDGIKALSWDQWALEVRDGKNTLVPVTTVKRFLRANMLEGQTRSAQKRFVKHFFTLPASIPMPAALRRELIREYDLPEPER